MNELLSTDGLAELQDTWKRLGLTYAGARPWGEFFETFKPTARDIETRFATNFIHYKANYSLMTTSVVVAGLLWCPMSIVALAFAAIASQLLVVVCPDRRAFIVPHLGRVAVTTKRRALAAAAAAPLILMFFGVLTWIALVFSFALALPIAHMALRPRSLSARYNAASDEVRALFSAARSPSAEVDDAEAGVVRDVPVRARAPRGVVES